jgi:hypothetical protein
MTRPSRGSKPLDRDDFHDRIDLTVLQPSEHTRKIALVYAPRRSSTASISSATVAVSTSAQRSAAMAPLHRASAGAPAVRSRLARGVCPAGLASHFVARCASPEQLIVYTTDMTMTNPIDTQETVLPEVIDLPVTLTDEFING